MVYDSVLQLCLALAFLVGYHAGLILDGSLSHDPDVDITDTSLGRDQVSFEWSCSGECILGAVKYIVMLAIPERPTNTFANSF